MKGLSLQLNKNAAKQRENSLHFSRYLLDQNYGIYVEDYFHEILYLERKRTERSRKPFLLMLLDFGRVPEIAENNEVRKKIVSSLFSLTRETDIKGWYRYGSVLGVIFTETNGIDKNFIKQKMHKNLCNVLDIKQIDKIKITSHVFPEEGDKQKTDETEPDLKLYPDLSKKNSSDRACLFLKRTLDIIGSILGALVFSSFFLIFSILIKLSSQGPVFFKQTRVGLYGKKFTFLKFRTMHVNNDDTIHKEYIKDLICSQKSIEEGKNNGGNGDKECIYKIKDDPRITPIGMFLRKTSLDELPQFFNVFKGDMSLVGPRPPIPYELENYDIWHRQRVIEIKPGITGLWQVRGRSSTTFDEMVRLDLQYIKEWSLWLDLKILLQTPWVVLTGKGAY